MEALHTMNSPDTPSDFVDSRHKYLERKVREGWQLCRCACGDHLDEKAELARYRRMLISTSLEKLTPRDRIMAKFEAMAPEEREAFLLELTEGVS
jgi:hypothetical protein